MQAWASARNLSQGLVPVVVPLGDLQDVSDIGDDEALSYSPQNLNAMLSRYNASEAVIAIAKPQGTAVNIQLYRTDRSRPEYVHQILERALPGQDHSQIYSRAVGSVQNALKQDWKKKTVADVSQKGTLDVHVSFNSLQEWSNVQRKLSRVSAISDVSLKALSPKDAYLTLTYAGTFERVKIALEQSDLFLETARARPVNASGNMGTDYSQGLLGGYQKPNTVYELVTRRTDPAAGSGATQNYTPGYTPPAAQQQRPTGYEPYQTRF